MSQEESRRREDTCAPVSTKATIHLDRLRTNVKSIREQMPDIELMGVVKANAYGHGSVMVAKCLEELGVTSLGVATVSEGVQLRNAGVNARITVFAPPLPDRVIQYEAFDLDPIVDSALSLSIIERSGIRARCHVKVDTGMGRLGQFAEDSVQIVRNIEASSTLDLSSLWTHFARADEPKERFTSIQIKRFDQFILSLGGAPAPLHVAASAAIYAHPETVDPSRYSMARVGIAMYGLLDLPKGGRPHKGLIPVMEFSSRVCAIKRVPKGTPISYGSLWTSQQDTFVATISAGYADGVLRYPVNRGLVRIGEDTFPVCGTVCMDMIMADIGENESDIQVGDPVSLFGASSPTCFDIADWASTITYVPICAVSSRVARVYTGS